MANPKSAEAQQAFIDQNPFDGFKIDDNSILSELQGRNPCPKCGKSRKFFCYTCYVPIAQLENRLPKIKLPIKIDIIKHKHEIDGKSTSGHAAILAPEDVRVYTYPDIPNYEEEQAVLIFPSHRAVTISQLIRSNDFKSIKNLSEDLPKGFNKSTLMKTAFRNANESQFSIDLPHKFPITKAVFIDSTWNQSKGIYKDERINRMPCVVIQNRISQFWRHQKKSPRWYLSTIEAIHQFLLELHLNTWGLHPDYKGIYNCFSEQNIQEFTSLYRRNDNAYNGQYDNLLYFFHHMYHLIHEYYDHDNLHAYKRRLM